MRAIVIRQHGSVEVLEEIELPDPMPRPGHVIIDVKATSVNPVDTKIREGSEGTAGLTFPAILHFDVAGVVSAVGEGVSRFVVGDRVYGAAGGVVGIPGALADRMEADADLLAIMPSNIAFGEAAAIPLVGITAWEALVERASIAPRDEVLIQGGTGGVGHLAVQIARARGARVTAAVSTPDKADLARRLGAEEIILYRDEAIESAVERITGRRGFDVVFDTVGGPSLQTSLKAARIKGHVVTIIGYDTYDLTDMHFKALRLDLVFMPIQLIHGVDRDAHGAILARLAKMVERQELMPVIDSRHAFTAEGARAAHARLESGRSLGKIVIER
jgi:NADPH2:quinone reductase